MAVYVSEGPGGCAGADDAVRTWIRWIWRHGVYECGRSVLSSRFISSIRLTRSRITAAPVKLTPRSRCSRCILRRADLQTRLQTWQLHQLVPEGAPTRSGAGGSVDI